MSGAKEWLDRARLQCDEDADEARRCIATALVQPDCDPLTYRNAAMLFGQRLGDPAKAREMLDRCVELMAGNRKSSAQNWRFVAHEYRVDAKDIDAAHRALDLGMKTLDLTVEDLCTFVHAYVEVGDYDTARATLARAEASAQPDDWQPLFKANYDVGNEARATALVHQVLASAETIDRCHEIASGVSLQSTTLQRAALARAEQLVATDDCRRTTSDWLRIAHSYHRASGDKADIQRCTDQARAHAHNDRDRAAVARVYRYRLDDRETAERLSPWQQPSALLPSRKVRNLLGWESDPARLFEWLRAQATREVLAKITGTRYGTEEHLAVLVDIQATGLLPSPRPQWWPDPLFGLRQAEAADIDHVARAFACTMCCLDPSGFIQSPLAMLVDSCRVLGHEALTGAIGLLVAVYESISSEHDSVIVRVALLLAAAARDAGDPRLQELYERVQQDFATRPLTDLRPGYNPVALRDPLWPQLFATILTPSPRLAPLAHRMSEQMAAHERVERQR